MTIEGIQDAIIAEFAALEDWFDKYEHLISLGREHPTLDDQFKTDAHAVSGCQSQVWIRTEARDGRLYFQADSDSLIIKGVIALILRAVNERPPAAIAAAKLYFLREIGLSTNLSPSRANGVATIVRHLQQRARRT